MFRRMYGRPRHLSYNRNMSFLPLMQNLMPFANNGNYQGMQSGFPMSSEAMGWNPEGYYNQYQGFPFQGFPSQNGAMQPNGFPTMMPPNIGGNGGVGMAQGGMAPSMNMMPPNTGGNGGMGMASPMNMMQQMPFMNPYPTQNQQSKPQSSQVQSFMNQFKGQDGNVDMKKMMDTAGQMMNTVNQLNGMVKGIVATFKA